jgi:hypothetical protein
VKPFGSFLAIAASVTVAACGGGGSAAPATVGPTASPAPTIAPTAAPQVITMSLPTSAIGQETDPTYGLIGGYTQQTYSQTLAFVPGAQIMIANGQAGVPHTLNVLSQTAFPSAPTLSTAAAGGTTLAAGFQSGSLAGDSTIGPITLTAGLYYIGCGYHYTSNTMRTVLNVATAAVPGPQATAVPAQPAPTPGGYGY